MAGVARAREPGLRPSSTLPCSPHPPACLHHSESHHSPHTCQSCCCCRRSRAPGLPQTHWLRAPHHPVQFGSCFQQQTAVAEGLVSANTHTCAAHPQQGGEGSEGHTRLCMRLPYWHPGRSRHVSMACNQSDSAVAAHWERWCVAVHGCSEARLDHVHTCTTAVMHHAHMWGHNLGTPLCSLLILLGHSLNLFDLCPSLMVIAGHGALHGHGGYPVRGRSKARARAATTAAAAAANHAVF